MPSSGRLVFRWTEASAWPSISAGREILNLFKSVSWAVLRLKEDLASRVRSGRLKSERPALASILNPNAEPLIHSAVTPCRLNVSLAFMAFISPIFSMPLALELIMSLLPE